MVPRLVRPFCWHSGSGSDLASAVERAGSNQPGWAFTENGSWDWDVTIFDLGGAPTGP